jgi:hypothetical protein
MDALLGDLLERTAASAADALPHRR